MISSRHSHWKITKGSGSASTFTPLDFTFVCPTEIVAFNTKLDEFEDRDCAVLTASTDSVYSHKGVVRQP